MSNNSLVIVCGAVASVGRFDKSHCADWLQYYLCYLGLAATGPKLQLENGESTAFSRNNEQISAGKLIHFGLRKKPKNNCMTRSYPLI